MGKKPVEVHLESPWVLMNPGPINLKDSVRLALLKPDLCHREPEFQELLEGVRRKIKAVFEVENTYSVALLAGSGTAGVEAMVLAGMPPEGKLLVIENGVYGERITAIAQAAKIPVVAYHLDWGEMVDYARLEAIISGDPQIKALAVIHHETTTGLVNDVTRIGQIARRHNLVYMCDSVSGLAAEEVVIEDAGFSLVASTANKGIHGVPGVSFVLIENAHLQKMAQYPKRSVYFDLPTYVKLQDSGTIPFTMPVHVMYAFDAALDELARETVAGRLERFRRRSMIVRDALQDLFEFFLPREAYGNTMSSFKLPAGITYDHIHDILKEKGIVVYAGQGGLAKSIFRIAHLGEYDDDRVLPVLIEALRGMMSKN